MRQITTGGYIVSKNEIPYVSDIKKELTLMPVGNKDYSFNIRPIKYYRETENELVVPKYYGIDKFGKAPFKGKVIPKKELYMSKAYRLRENQKEITKMAIDELESTGGAIICLGTGMGKTSIALYIISQFSKSHGIKPLIIVNKVPLLEQWKERIEQFMPALSIGVIQGKRNEKNRDITIGMIHTIALKKGNEVNFSDFNFIIIDETHHLSSTEFSNIMFKCSGRFTLGLSATPERKDGLTKAIVWSLGKILTISNEQKRKCIVQTHDFRHTIEKKYLYNGKLNMANAITEMCSHTGRTNDISDIIKKMYCTKERRILVLSDRIDLLKRLYNILVECDRGLYIGKMKKDELLASSKKRIIFASFSIFSEGIDIPELNSLVLCSPKSDIIQVSGRIFRKEHSITPLIVDIIDHCDQIFVSQSRKRKAFYINSGFVITNASSNTSDEYDIEQMVTEIKGCGIESDSE